MGSYVIYTCQSCGKRCQKGSPIRCLYCNRLLCWTCQKGKICPKHYETLTPEERSMLKSTYSGWGALSSLSFWGAFGSFMAMCVLFGTQNYWGGAIAIALIPLTCWGSFRITKIRDQKMAAIRKQISARLADGGADEFIDVPMGGGKSVVANRAVVQALIAAELAKNQAQPTAIPLADPNPQPPTLEPTSAQTQICSACGKPNAMKNAFCMHCGQKLI